MLLTSFVTNSSTICLFFYVFVRYRIFYNLTLDLCLRSKCFFFCLAKKDKELQNLKDYSNDFIKEFRKLKERISRDGDEMIYEHGEEVLFLFDCLKKLSGVDLKYANESDLVLPLRTILDMKEKRQKKQRKNAAEFEKKSYIDDH